MTEELVGSRTRLVVEAWKKSGMSRHFIEHRTIDPVVAKLAPFPDWVAPELVGALRARGIGALYSHQQEACDAVVARNENIVIATPTASGKTLCYNLPVFQALLTDPGDRALYLFPTKALARDQVEEARALAEATEGNIGVAVYDGDTPPEQRRAARRQARILATNPEMLHTAILPHHPSWAELLSGLRYVVIDELHVYRGVFGSHFAHVLRRLLRLARHYGADPVLIFCSATIANPAELAESLTGRPARLISSSGAPRGPREFLIYNPPLVDSSLGIRESYLKASCTITHQLIEAGVNTLVFCRSRLAVEVLLRHLRDMVRMRAPVDEKQPQTEATIRGYRGGYLPARRRSVEQALRCGDTQVVVATSALELGIDIGAIDAVVIAGWPGSRAAVWQRAGRAGRRLAPSLAVLVSSSEPLDQHVAADPDYLFGQQPEHARINPDNVSILLPHVKCAAYELPFARDEAYGSLAVEETADVLECMAEASLLHRGAGGRYHYVDQAYPANEVALRGPLTENFLVVNEQASPQPQVIAEVDYDDATQELHDHAIYQLEGKQYQVRQLDHDNHKAYVSPVDVDYYTDALTQTQVRVLDPRVGDELPAAACCYGEVHLVRRVVGFKKIKLHTHENIGFGEVNQPDREMHTSALWLTVPPSALKTLQRTPAEIANATLGVARVLHAAAALLVMSDMRDLGRAVGDVRSSWAPVVGRSGRMSGVEEQQGPYAPTIYLFDRYPGGTGLCQRLYDERASLLARSRSIVARCGCERGCPTCIGPSSAAEGARSKALAIQLLETIEGALHAGYLHSRAHLEQRDQVCRRSGREPVARQ